jgi:hypothetical protein
MEALDTSRPGELGHHGLVLKGGLQDPLAHLGLVGGVGGQELAPAPQGLDHGGNVVEAGPAPQKGLSGGKVFPGQAGKLLQNRPLRHGVGEVDGGV